VFGLLVVIENSLSPLHQAKDLIPIQCLIRRCTFPMTARSWHQIPSGVTWSRS
jgi:hypothetical protein